MSIDVHFSNPPLNEVVIGVQFDGLGWTLSDYGRYHDSIRSKFSTVNTVASIPHPAEQPGLVFSNSPSMPRAWFVEDGGNYLIQVQKDRFLLNWRVIPGVKSEYPHFEFFFKRFKEEWENFKKYVDKNVGGKIAIKHYELTYINHLVKDQHWHTVNDLEKYFKHLSFLNSFPSSQMLGLDLGYVHDSYPVKHTIKKGLRAPNNEELFVLDFSIFEKISSEDDFDMRVKKANDVMGETFVSLTSDLAHKEWGKA